MNIEQFCAQYGDAPRNIRDVVLAWQLHDLDPYLRALGNRHDDLIGSAVIVGDLLQGGTLLDQMPSELRDAIASLMKEKANTFEGMRQFLLDHMHSEDGGFLSLDDRHVGGFVNWVKGRIGENLFQQQVGDAASLADSAIQEGWDISIRQADGACHYVQVKLYDNPNGVVRHMLKVQQKIANGVIPGEDGLTPVDHIFFAVPEDIHGEVLRLAKEHPGLSAMLYEQTIPIDATGAAAIVTEGMANVGPEQLSHFFEELLGGAAVAGSLHAIVNGFLWYKGSKELHCAFADTSASTTISTAGIGLGLLTETLCEAAMLSGAVGIAGRFVLGRIARSRWNFADYLDNSISQTDTHINQLQPA